MSHRIERQLVIQAVLMALWQKLRMGSVIFHSDRGSQYTSYEYQQFLKSHNVVSSMNAVGSSHDNAAAESFFGLLKRERVNRRKHVTRAQTRANVFDYIERFYNQKKKRNLDSDNIHQLTLN